MLQNRVYFIPIPLSYISPLGWLFLLLHSILCYSQCFLLIFIPKNRNIYIYNIFNVVMRKKRKNVRIFALRIEAVMSGAIKKLLLFLTRFLGCDFRMWFERKQAPRNLSGKPDGGRGCVRWWSRNAQIIINTDNVAQKNMVREFHTECKH